MCRRAGRAPPRQPRGHDAHAIVERALRLLLMQKREPGAPLADRWVVVSGDREPDVDIADRDRLYDALGERRP